jgi:Tol biopolymer transport system component
VGQFGEGDIWVYDLKRGTASRLNSHPADDLNPVWSGDGGRIIFTSTRRGQRDLYQKSANGLGSTKPLFVSEQQAKSLHDLSPDGHYAIYGAMVEGGLWILPLFGELKPLAFVKSQFHPHSARFSPTGRYIAYASGETGTNEIYVQTFPQHRGKWQISTNGGMEPMWRQDQKELFFLTPDDKMMAVNLYTDSGKLRPGVPRMLFQTHLIGSGWRNRYVVSPDGQHFLMLVPAGEAKPEPINVVLNWPALLKKQ